MPAGCEFICNNQICSDFKNGFSITGPWPMAPIELVIANLNPKNQTQEEVKQHLIELKNQSRKYALITLPNEAKLDTAAYRISLWSEEAKCVWSYDVAIDEMATWTPPDKCPNTGGKLLSFKEVTEQGINCPSCNAPLKQNRWTTKETNARAK